MPIVLQQNEAQSTLLVEGEMTIYTAAELKDGLQRAFAQSDNVEIDLSGVTDMDTAGLQLLLAARQEAQRSSKTFRLKAPGEAIRQTLQLCDLTDNFRDCTLSAA